MPEDEPGERVGDDARRGDEFPQHAADAPAWARLHQAFHQGHQVRRHAALVDDVGDQHAATGVCGVLVGQQQVVHELQAESVGQIQDRRLGFGGVAAPCDVGPHPVHSFELALGLAVRVHRAAETVRARHCYRVEWSSLRWDEGRGRVSPGAAQVCFAPSW